MQKLSKKKQILKPDNIDFMYMVSASHLWGYHDGGFGSWIVKCGTFYLCHLNTMVEITI